MSWIAVQEVMRASQARHGARLVMLALAEAARGESPLCWSGQDVLQAATLLSEREVRQALRWCEQHGEIETRQATRGRARFNVYRLMVGCYRDREVSDADLHGMVGVLLSPFSRPADSAARQDDETPTTTARPADIAARHDADDRQNSSLTTGRIRLNPSRVTEPEEEPEETGFANAHPVAAAGGKGRASTKSIAKALADGLGRKPSTRSEHGLFGAAAAELHDAGASVDQVKAACAAARRQWPDAKLQPKTITAHWSNLTRTPEHPGPDLVAAATALVRNVGHAFDPDQLQAEFRDLEAKHGARLNGVEQALLAEHAEIVGKVTAR